MDYKISFFLFWIGFIGGFIVGFFSYYATVGIIALAFVQALIFYRCPHCKYLLLNVSGKIPAYCPECGEALI